MKLLKRMKGIVPLSGEVQKIVPNFVNKYYDLFVLVDDEKNNKIISIQMRNGKVPESGKVHTTLKGYEGKEYIFNIYSHDKSYVDLKDVKRSTTEIELINCPECGKEHSILFGYPLKLLKEDIEEGLSININFKKAETNTDESGLFYPCCSCEYVFLKDKDNLWYKKTVESLICPICDINIPKHSTYKDGIGYCCPNCHSYLEYTGYPHHGSCKVKVRSTSTDYFEGICPNCSSDLEIKKMTVGDQIWVENHRVILGLICPNCDYRDSVKIRTSGKRPNILTGE